MSRYGPTDGPGPVERPPAEYTPPSDPWGDAALFDPYAAPPSSYHPHPAGAADWRATDWHTAPTAAPAPPPPARHNTALLVALALAVLVAAAALATTVYVVSGDEPAAAPSPSPDTGTGGGTTPGPRPSTDNLGLAAGFARVGDCLVNDGTADEPQMRITLCDADEEGPVYRVLARFDTLVEDDDGARRVCGSTDGYRYHYYFINEGRDEGFVLCMTDVP